MHRIEVFHTINEAVFFIGITLGLVVISELAFLYGKRASKKMNSDYSSLAENLSTALIGLLALLLGFAFAMALSRFDTRKELLRQEVNDLHTAFRVTDFLPLDEAKEAKIMLADYAKLRADYYKKGTVAAKMEDTLQATKALQNKMWDNLVELRYTEKHENTPQLMEFSKSLNTVYNNFANRTAARNDHVPEAILWLLLIVSIIAVCTKAHSHGLRRAHLFLPRLCMILAIASVLSIILDLDRPIRGLIQIDQHEMTDLYNEISQDIEPPKNK